MKISKSRSRRASGQDHARHVTDVRSKSTSVNDNKAVMATGRHSWASCGGAVRCPWAARPTPAMHFSPLRTAIIVIVAVLGILFTIPSFISKDDAVSLPGCLPKQQVTLGLDLQGGSLPAAAGEQGLDHHRAHQDAAPRCAHHARQQ
ncbi:MAG: hypothetical protein QM702_10665 [Rubrivivax sp.]